MEHFQDIKRCAVGTSSTEAVLLRQFHLKERKHWNATDPFALQAAFPFAHKHIKDCKRRRANLSR